MRNDYPLKGKTETISLAIEADVAFKLKKMAEQTKYTEAELLNTALKRFIATHSDFLPASAGGSRTGN